MSRTCVTQPRIASFIASFSVRDPLSTDVHVGAEQLHPEDVQRLPAHVLGAHEDRAFHAEHRADRRRGDAVLARAGLGEDLALAHALREQTLRDRVVDLVRAGVREILAFDVDLRAAEALASGARRSTAPSAARRSAQQMVELEPERLVVAGLVERGRQLVERHHQRLRHVAPAVRAEVTKCVRDCRHHPTVSSTLPL